MLLVLVLSLWVGLVNAVTLLEFMWLIGYIYSIIFLYHINCIIIFFLYHLGMRSTCWKSMETRPLMLTTMLRQLPVCKRYQVGLSWMPPSPKSLSLTVICHVPAQFLNICRKFLFRLIFKFISILETHTF